MHLAGPSHKQVGIQMDFDTMCRGLAAEVTCHSWLFFRQMLLEHSSRRQHWREIPLRSQSVDTTEYRSTRRLFIAMEKNLAGS